MAQIGEFIREIIVEPLELPEPLRADPAPAPTSPCEIEAPEEVPA